MSNNIVREVDIMPKNLYLMGTAGSGKSVVALGLARAFQERGIKTAYFKPKSSGGDPNKRVDDDLVLMKEVLGMEHSYEIISPFRIGPLYLSTCHLKNPDDMKKGIFKSYELIAKDAEVVLIEGSNTPFASAGIDMDDFRLASDLSAQALVVTKIVNDYSLDAAVFMNKLLKFKGLQITGHIFNNVRRILLDKTRGIYQPLLEAKGELLGIIPEDPMITAPTVLEYQEALGGEVLTGEDQMDRIVEDVVVGSMNIESALAYLRRSLNKAVITGGDRSDLALTALETNTSVLILTGGLYPDVRVLSKAEERKVPVILVHTDTYTTIQRIHHLSRHIKPMDKNIIELAHRQVVDHCKVDLILQKLGIEKA